MGALTLAQKGLLAHAVVGAAVVLITAYFAFSYGGMGGFLWIVLVCIAWGAILRAHAGIVLDLMRESSLRRGTGGNGLVAQPDRGGGSAANIDRVERRVHRLWRIARQVPDPAVRERAFRVTSAADRVAAVMAADGTDGETVAWFDGHLLRPTEELLDGYARLSTRVVAGSEATLRKVEEENLPAIEARLDALYDQLHRGDLVDLAVTSELLDLQLDDPLPRPAASRGG